MKSQFSAGYAVIRTLIFSALVLGTLPGSASAQTQYTGITGTPADGGTTGSFDKTGKAITAPSYAVGAASEAKGVLQLKRQKRPVTRTRRK
jgi:hypothetical protein